MAILILNNIVYASGDRNRAVDDSVAFIGKINGLFHKPVIAVHGWRLPQSYSARLIGAGAIEVFQLPWKNEDMQQAIKRCVSIW